MPLSVEIRNTISSRSEILDCEIEGHIADAAASSLSAFQAAATVLRKAEGVSPLQLLAAAIEALREQGEIISARVTRRWEHEIHDLHDRIASLEVTIEALQAQVKKARRKAP